MSAPVDRYVAFFEELRPASLAALPDLFSESARFADPFNDVRGHTAIRRVLEDMYERCEAPRFSVDDRLCSGDTCYLRWTFDFGGSEKRRQVRGVSRVCFGPDGRAVEHVDYWDPAKQVYEQIPLLGALLRILRRSIAAKQDRPTTNRSDSSLATER